MIHDTACARAWDAPNWVAEHLGASSRRPRHPFPALMAGVSPGRVPVYTAPKKKNLPVTPRNATAETYAVFCTSGLHGLDGHVTVQIHLPLLTSTLVHQLEPGIVVVVWANIVVAAEPVIQHAYTPNELLVLEIIEEEFPIISFTVPNRIVSSIRSETTTNTTSRRKHSRSTKGPQNQGRLPTKST